MQLVNKFTQLLTPKSSFAIFIDGSQTNRQKKAKQFPVSLFLTLHSALFYKAVELYDIGVYLPSILLLITIRCTSLVPS